MIGKLSPQGSMFDVGNVFPIKLPPGSFHAQLAAAAERLFKDADFIDLYSKKMGRPSVPPSSLALTLLLQHQANVSDEEAINLTAFDARWAVVLRKEIGEPLCAKSTLQLFRSQLVLHPEVHCIFAASIEEARRAGLLKSTALETVLDTKPMRGRGAVKDTVNLLATGIRQLARALARRQRCTVNDILQAAHLERYARSSVKGDADIDWDDEAAKSALLTRIVADAKHLMDLAAGGDEKVVKASELLCKLLLQDIEVTSTPEGGEQAEIKEGTAQGRIPSATDTEMRHGRKSASKRFNGYKADIAVDADSQTIVAYDVLPGDAPDADGALDMTKQAEENTGLPVAKTVGDCAFGGGPTREEYAKDGRILEAKVPKESSNNGMFTKSAFTIDVEHHRVICPAGRTTERFRPSGEAGGVFLFGAVCADCPLRAQCTTNAKGRSVSVHPQEATLQAARAYQQSPEGRANLRRRVVVEHSLARLGQLGIGQARYFGRAKARFQLMMASSIANFRRVWNWEAGRSSDSDSILPQIPEIRGHHDRFGLLSLSYLVLSWTAAASWAIRRKYHQYHRMLA